ncbi:MAG: hypothetical protein IPN92_00015 [Chromatiaceae bacterium]|nr:hypothetical protein [Chromatiaceae bacterium]
MSTRALLYQGLLPLAAASLFGLSAGAWAAKVEKGHFVDGAYQIIYNLDEKAYHVKGDNTLIPAAEVERSMATVLCAKCHEDAIAQLKNSVHFTGQGPNPRILFPGGGAHGQVDRACGLPGTTALINYNSDINLGECGKCHTGRFMPPMQNAFLSTFMQQGMPQELAAANAQSLVDGGLNCLICHAETYLSVRDDLSETELDTLRIAGYAAPGEASPSPEGYANLSRDNTDFDHDGVPDKLIDTDGDGDADVPLMMDTDGNGVPETPWPTVAQDRSVAAILSVGATDEHACLRCHEHARTGYKRGTLFREGYDVHASADCFDVGDGCAKNTCTACHVTLDADLDGDGLLDVHKFVRGHLVGGDLAAADYPPPAPGVAPNPDDPTHLTCVQCHPAVGLSGEVHSEGHLDKIACETCHIIQSGGITYSMYGHGGHLSFGRNAAGLDTKVITADHMIANEDVGGDIDADFAAYRLTPVLMWFNGSTSFLAQSLAVRGAENAKIAPFKPMANGMVMDGRFFAGKTALNEAGFPYNKFSMYGFFAKAADCDTLNLPGTGPFTCGDDGLYGNAEVFTALGLLGEVKDKDGNVIVQGLTPEATRKLTLADMMDMTNANKQAMAMMMGFPNLMNFSKAAYGYEHYLVSSALAGSPPDANSDGFIDPNTSFLFDMFGAVNAGLDQFKGFNVPMFLPADYDWYKKFTDVSNVATMKLPDGSDMKLFLAMQLQAQGATPEEIQQLVGNYPAFSNGITLGGHGVAPNPEENALGAEGSGQGNGCADCHGAGGLLDSPVPVTDKVLVDVKGLGQAEMPVWRWVYYHAKRIINLGLKTADEDIAAGTADIDIAGDRVYLRPSRGLMVLNWFDPRAKLTLNGDELTGYRRFTRADSDSALAGTNLTAQDLTWNGGPWMPVLEPVTKSVPNYAVLGYTRDEVIVDDVSQLTKALANP